MVILIEKISSLYPSKTLKGKEDYHQSILFYKDGGVIRFNNVSFKTKFLAPGGLGTNRYNMYKTAQEYLVKKYC